MNRKGFASAGILYSLLVVFLLLTVGTLSTMQNKKTVLDSLKTETATALYCDKVVFNDLKNYGDAQSSDILSGKTVLVKGQKVTGTIPKRSASSKSLSTGNSVSYSAGYYPNGWTVSCTKPYTPAETTKTEFVDVTAIREKTKANGDTENVSISNTDWSNCASYSGKYVRYFSDKEDTDTTTYTLTTWSIPMNYNTYINSSKIEITLYAFDKNTTDSNGNYSDVYDKSVYGEEFYFRIDGKARELKIIIDRKNNEIRSSVDYNVYKTIVSIDSKYYGWKNIYSGFYYRYDRTSSSLELTYDAYDESYKSYYSSMKRFNTKASNYETEFDKWWSSSSSDDYEFVGYDAAQRYEYYGKNNTRDEDEFANASTSRLQTRYNKFAADIKYTGTF